MVNERAKQFLPFQSLKGLETELRKREKVKVAKKELSFDQVEEISRELQKIQKGMLVCVVYYENDEYIKKEGIVLEINIPFQYLQIVKEKIDFQSILEIRIIEESQSDLLK